MQCTFQGTANLIVPRRGPRVGEGLGGRRWGDVRSLWASSMIFSGEAEGPLPPPSVVLETLSAGSGPGGFPRRLGIWGCIFINPTLGNFPCKPLGSYSRRHSRLQGRQMDSQNPNFPGNLPGNDLPEKGLALLGQSPPSNCPSSSVLLMGASEREN